GAETAGEEGGDDGGRDLENVGVQLVARCKDKLQQTDDAAEKKGDGEVDEPAFKGKRCHTRRRNAIHGHSKPGTKLGSALHDLVKPLRRLLHAEFVVNNFLVDVMDVSELPEVDAPGLSDDLDLG